MHHKTNSSLISTKCRHCGSLSTKREKALLNSTIRYLKRKRPLLHCNSCNKSFHTRWLISQQTSAIFIFSIIIGYTTIYHSSSFNFLEKIKSMTVNSYQYIYGVDHKHKLKQHWGWMYQEKEVRDADYERHQQ